METTKPAVAVVMPRVSTISSGRKAVILWRKSARLPMYMLIALTLLSLSMVGMELPLVSPGFICGSHSGTRKTTISRVKKTSAVMT
jgi:hypothetical protein